MRTWLKLTASHRCNLCGQSWPVGTIMLKLTFPRAKASSYRGPCCSGEFGDAPVILDVPPLPFDINDRQRNRTTKPMVGIGKLAAKWR
jgi:hypothetical protein